MNTLHTSLRSFYIVLILSSITSNLASQTYDLAAERERWLFSKDDSLNSQSPDSIIRLEPLIQYTDDGKTDTNNDILPNSFSENQTHTHIPTSVTIDTSKDVGEIPFSSSMSPAGGLVYNVPIDVPAGRNDFQPQISIVYNSQGGNDVLGFGWSIGGLSSINRVNKNIYYNKQTAPVTSKTDDAFVLDGMRLLPVSGKPYTYEPEQGNARIKAYLSSGNIDHFTIEYPNGNIGTFSSTNGISYPLTKLLNTMGDTITFTYETADNHLYIKKIEYGSRPSSIRNFAHVSFTYITRKDIISTFENGKEVKLTKLLNKIECFNEEQLLHTYSFNYQNDNVSLLNKIGLDNLNPLSFYYGYNEPKGTLRKSKSTFTSYFSTDIPLKFCKGKFYHGSDDEGLIVYPDKNPCVSHYEPAQPGMGGHHSKYYYESEYHPDQKLLVYPNLNLPLLSPSEVIAEDGFQTLLSIDIDGRPGEEVLKINNTLEGNYDILTFKIYRPQPSGSLVSESAYSIGYDALTHVDNKSIWPKIYLPGDFNGDGIMEILAVSMYKPLEQELNSKCFLYDLLHKKKLYEGFAFNFDVQNSQIIPMDVDGDGKTDICHIYNDGMDVYSFNIDGATYTLNWMFSFNDIKYSEVKDKLLMPGDLNNDGKPDLLISPKKSYQEWKNVLIFVNTKSVCPECGFEYPNSDVCPECHRYIGDATVCAICKKPIVDDKCPEHGYSAYLNLLVPQRNGTSWDMYLSTGKSFIKKSQNIIEYFPNRSYALHDVDENGLCDFVVSAYSSIRVLLNKYSESIGNEEINIDIPSGSYVVPSSVVSNNYHNCLLAVQGASVNKVSCGSKAVKRHLLTGLVNSFGVIQRNYYQRLNDKNGDGGTDFYTLGNSANFPYEDFIGPLWTIAKQESLSNGTILGVSSFKYKGAVAHRQGLGFKGFTEIITTDLLRNRHSTKTFNPQKFGTPVKEVTPFSETTYNYSVTVDANKKANISLNLTATKDLLKNTTIAKRYTYDIYKNPVAEVTQYSDGTSGDAVRTAKEIEYLNIDSNTKFLIGLPKLIKVEDSRGANTWTQSQELSYKTGTPLVETIITKINEYQVEKKEMRYDEYGNVLSEKSTPYNKNKSLGTTYIYDSNHRYVITEIDQFGDSTKYSLFNKFGLPQKVKNYKQQTSTYNFDALGRVTTINTPDGTVESTTYTWDSSIGLYRVTQNATGQAQIRTYYDALNRELRKGQQRFNGSWQYVDTQYDDFGRVKRVSLPYKSTASYWVINSYDDYDRITKVEEPLGKSMTTSYSGNSVTVVQNGISTTHTYDKRGLLATVSDPAGTITYEYRPDKQLNKVTAPGNIVTSFDYDNYGRRTKIIDPSAGTKTFGYDTAGNVSEETDANGKIVRMIYDTYDRLIQREYVGELTTDYTYNSDGLLILEKSNNGTEKKYTYDEFSRLLIEKEALDTEKQNLVKTYSYENGNISEIGYSSEMNSASTAIGYESYIYTYGTLSEIRWKGNTSIWKLTGEDERGLPTSSATGGLNRSYNYDINGNPTKRIVKYGNNTLQDFSYGFSTANGNLLWRKDNTRNKQEDFEYDNLNRLISFGGKRVGYDNKGNITQLSGIGTLEYNSSRPYAVSNVLPAMNCRIPSTPQTVTYNGMMRPKSIKHNDYSAELSYNAAGERVKMSVKKPTLTKIVGGSYTNYYYLGSRYEVIENTYESIHKKIFYIGGDAYKAPAVYVKNGNNPWTLYYICRDYLGSITHIISTSGNVVQELSYDAWGNLRNPQTQGVYTPGNEPELFLGRGYTGHEHLTPFGLINMNARLYDPMLGRFLSPDPYVQTPENSQNFNRYSYCLNNPLRYTDENGEFFFSLFLGPVGAFIDAACWGAAIGAGTSAAVYSISVLATGQSWNSGNFWRSVGMGALGGAIGGGMGYIGSVGILGSFGNTFGYNMLSEISNITLTNYVFGNDVNLKSMISMTAGALTGSFLPTFKGGVRGQNIKNAILETGFNTARGAATGLVTGGVDALINKDADYIWQGMAGGAMGGAGRSILMNLAFGAPYKAKAIFKDENGEKEIPALQRDGGILNIWGDITIGRNANSVNGLHRKHESIHVLQQEQIGWATFYGRTISEYISAFIKTGRWDSVYDIPGTLENYAKHHSENIKF